MLALEAYKVNQSFYSSSRDTMKQNFKTDTFKIIDKNTLNIEANLMSTDNHIDASNLVIGLFQDYVRLKNFTLKVHQFSKKLSEAKNLKFLAYEMKKSWSNCLQMIRICTL